MLHQVISEIKNSQGAVSVKEIGQKLNIEPTAVEDMIEFWVRKGRLKVDQNFSPQSDLAGGCAGCTSSCTGAEQCPFVMKLPKTFTPVNRAKP